MNNQKLNKIKIIVPFYNPGDMLDACIVSLLTQDYDNYEVLFIDDCSTDGSFNKIPDCKFELDENGQPKKDEKGEIIITDMHPLLKKTKCKNVLCWRSSQRNTALANIYNGVVNWAKDPDDIVLIVDGDDALISKSVLSYVNDMYNYGIGGLNKIAKEDSDLSDLPQDIRKTNEVLMTYGSCSWSDGRKCFSRPYSKQEFEKIKTAPYKISHLRTFKSKVFLEIIKQDPDANCFKDDKGNFYLSGYDTAIWIPLLQICGYEHTFYNSKPLYFYNIHPNNDHNVNQELQWNVHAEALKKPAFKKIEL
jgi:glycosyltransferase involved in cell wall biosynthesis